MFSITAAFLLLQGSNGQLPAWGGLGVGGALAGIIFWFYCKREKDIVAILSKFTETFQATIEKNAMAMAETSAGLRELADAIRGWGLAKERQDSDTDGRQRSLGGAARDKDQRV